MEIHGVTAEDNLIILIVFWILGGICCCFQCGISIYVFRLKNRYEVVNLNEVWTKPQYMGIFSNQNYQTPYTNNNTSNNTSIEEKQDTKKTQEHEELKEVPIEGTLIQYGKNNTKNDIIKRDFLKQDLQRK